MKRDLKVAVTEEDLMHDACSFYYHFRFHLRRAFGWADTTLKSYGNYIDQLKPYLKDIPLKDTDIDTFLNAITLLNAARKKKYNNNTLKTIKSVINDICRFAECYSYGKYHNVLWGTTWHKDKEIDYLKEIGKDIQKIIEKKLAVPKSLSLREEVSLISNVRDTVAKESYAVGLAIMFYMGLRPGECAGLKYGDIRPLKGHPEVNCLYVYSQIRTSKEATSTLKTENAYRVLPIPRELNEMLEERKEYLLRRFDTISDLPIICKDNNAVLTAPCNPNKFAEYCKYKLREIEVQEATLRDAAEESAAEGRGEEAATSYLLRRNFATAMLAVCGLEADEIKYLMGHAIETLNESRYDYLNPNVLYRIWEKENIRSYFTNVRSEFTIDEKALNIHRKNAFINVPETYFVEHPEGVILNVHNTDATDRVNMIVQEGKYDSIIMMSFNQVVPQKRADRVRIESEFAEAAKNAKKRIKAVAKE